MVHFLSLHKQGISETRNHIGLSRSTSALGYSDSLWLESPRHVGGQHGAAGKPPRRSTVFTFWLLALEPVASFTYVVFASVSCATFMDLYLVNAVLLPGGSPAKLPIPKPLRTRPL